MKVSMCKTMRTYEWKNLSKDLLAGLVIMAVSIPISMGYAQIAGLPAVYGLYGSVFPIVLFALFSTSPQFVFGVDAAPAALVGSALVSLGIEGGSKEAIAAVPVLAFFVAVWLLVFYLCRAGKLVNYISAPVMGGFITGGMGTFSPSPFYTEEVDAFCKAHIYQATVDAMAAEGREFKGIIFFGLMLTADGPKVLEYNARFGDPEAQVVLPRMKTDIVDVFEACIDGTLDQIDLEFEDNAAVCVVLASDGYPVSYQKGFPIKGLDAFKEKEGYYVFHAGTAKKDGQIVTNGGRVLGVVAKGDDLKQARANAYKAIDLVEFDNKYYRHDIGKAIDEA